MKRTTLRRLATSLAFVAMVLFAPSGLRAQTIVEIGDGTSTQNTNPFGTYYNYSIAEQLYTASEIGMAGTITSISFYYNGTAAKDFPIVVYMKHVTNTDLSSGGISLADADEVFNGTYSVTTTAGWFTIDLDVPFSYDGTSNLLIGINKGYVYYYNGQTWRGTSTSTTMARYTQQDGSAYTTSNIPSTAQSTRPNIQLEITPSGSYCPRPTGLAATLTPGNGTIATLNWTEAGTATAWKVIYGTGPSLGQDDDTVHVNVTGTPTANLTGLTAEQTYYASVKAICGTDDESQLTTAISFTPTNAYTLTVNDGTSTNEYVPFYGYYADAIQRGQMIIPAADLAAMAGGEITQMVFYIDHYSLSSDIGNWIVSLGETTATTLNGLDNTTTLTQVYSGAMTFDAGITTMTVTFTDGYVYNGGNLLVEFNHPVSAGYSHYYFTGISATGASFCYDDQRNFLPKITFSFIPTSTSCPRPMGLTVDASSLSAHTATLSWTRGDAETAWEICLDNDETNLTTVTSSDVTISGTTVTYTLTSLLQDHAYTAKVRAYCDATEQSIWSNVVNFSTPVACPAPTALTATNITDQSATLGWTAPDPAPANGYNVRYRPANEITQDFDGGLGAWTTIDADNDGYTWILASQSAGYYHSTTADLTGQGFNASYDFIISGSYTNAGNTELYPDNYLVSPQIALGGTISFWAEAQDANYPAEHFGVYVSTTSNTDTSTFVAVSPEWIMDANGGSGAVNTEVSTLNNIQWGYYTVDLSAYAGQTGYVAIRHFNCNNEFLINIDNITITLPTSSPWIETTVSTNSLSISGLDEQTIYAFEVQANCGGGEVSNWIASTFTTLPSCMPVSNLAVADATTTTITLTWTDNNAGAATYVVTDNSDNPYTVTNLTATGCTVTGLTANTAYTFLVRADCGGDTSSAVSTSGRTACDAITTVPYVESFENANDNYCWTLDGFAIMNNNLYSYDGNSFIVAQNSSTEPRYVILPEMADDISDLMLNFWWTNANQGYNLGYLYIGYLTDASDTSTFEEVGVIDMTNSIDVYEQSADYSFTAAPAGSRMALKYIDGSDGGVILIDNVTVDNLAACMRPSGLAVSAPTAHGATFEWTPGDATQSAWQLYFSTSNVAPSAAETDVIAATSNPFTLTTGLNAETPYYVWVRANCGTTDGFSTWSGPATFTTGIACPAPTDLATSNITGHTANLSWSGTSTSYNIDYRTAAYMNGTTEEFGTTSIPSGWSRSNTLLTDDVLNGTTTLNSYSGGWNFGTSNGVFSSHARVNIYGTNCKYWLITPATTLISNAALSFDMALTAYSGTLAPPQTTGTDDRFVVLLSADDGTTWTILRQWDNAGSSYVYNDINATATGENVNIDLSAYNGQSVKIAFYGESTTSNADNNLHIDNVTIGTPVSAGAWQTTTSTTESTTLSGLDPETLYEAKVQGNCGSEGLSAWTASAFFTTNIACPAPTTLTAGTPGPNQVQLSWTKHGTETAWQISTGDDDNPIDVTTGFTTNADTVTYTLTGLTASTAYTVKVRANCGTTDGTSAWSNTISFTTAATCPVPVLESTGITNVAGHTATVAWTGFSQNDSYVVNYRTAAYMNGTTEEFGTTSIPSGWSRSNTLLTDDVLNGTTTLNSYSGGWSFGTSNGVFSSHARVNIYSTSCRYWLITPATTLISNAALSFDMALTNYNGTLQAPATTGTDDRFVVLLSADDGTTWTILRQWDNAGSSYVYNDINATATGENVNIDLSAYNGQSVKIAFYGESTTSNADNNLHIDNVTIGTPVSAGAWQTVNITAPTTSTTLTGLDPETLYQVYVTGHCTSGNVTTAPSDTLDFTTTIACPAPTTLDTSNVTTNSVDLSWTENGSATAWKLCLNGDETHLIAVSTNPYTLTGLSENTAYTVKVQADCGSVDGTSAWSNIVNFTTLASCPAPTGFAVDNTTITAHTADLSWTAGGSETAWEIYLTDDATDIPDNSTTATATSSTASYTASGLTAETAYYAYVRAVCGSNGTSDWAGPVNFTTDIACPAPTSLAVDNTSITTQGANLSWNGTASNYIIMIGEEYVAINADFENNTIPSNFTTTGSYPWTTVANNHSGSYCAKSSNDGVNSSTSDMNYEVTLTADATLTFSAKISSETNWDKGYFSIDGTVQSNLNGISGNGSWIDYSYALTAGIHTLRWYYSKDGSSASNDDCFYVDDIKISVDPSTWDETRSATASPYTITGLNPETNYQVRVKADCGSEGLSSPSAPVSFTTLVACPAPMSLIANNETADGAILTWTAGGSETSWQVAYSTNATFDPDDISFPGIGEDTATVFNATDTLTGLSDNTTYYVKVRAICGGIDGNSAWISTSFTTLPLCQAVTTLASSNITAHGATLTWTAVGSETDWDIYITDDATIIPDNTTTPTATSNTASYSATGLTAETPYYAYVRANCGTNNTSDWTSVNFTTLVACPAPTNLAAANLTGHTADLSWTGTSFSYNIDYRTAAYFNGINESFGTSLPSGWENKTGLLSNIMAGTALTNGSQWIIGSNNGVFDNHARINIFGNSRYGWLITPEINVATGFELNFDLALTAYSGTGAASGTCDDDRFVVLITTDNEATWTILREWNNSGSADVYNDIPTAGTNVNINLSSYVGQHVKIAFYGESTVGSNGDNNLHIDNVTCGLPVAAGAWQHTTSTTASTTLSGLDPETPYEAQVQSDCTSEGEGTSTWTALVNFTTTVACPAPTTLTIVSKTTTTATIGWTSFATAWVVAYKAEGETSFTEVPVTTNPFTITGLTAANNYTVKVKADCSADSDGESVWSTTLDFATECPASSSLNYTCGFEGPNTMADYKMPLCWTRMGSSPSYPYVATSGSSAHEGTHYLYFYKSSSTYYTNEIAALPSIDADLNTVRISFYGKLASTSTDGTINVGYVTDLDDYTTFTSVQTVTLTTTYDRYTVSFGNVSTTSGYIALQSLYNSASATIHIDDITVEAIPSCVEPLAPVASNITAHGATLTWTAGGSETAWDIYYTDDATDIPDNTTTPSVSNTTDNPCTVTGLTATTHYYAYVRARCSATNLSPWSTVEDFTTPCEAITITYAAPYTQDFETPVVTSIYSSLTGLQLPSCWDNPYTTGTSAAGHPHLIAAGASYNYSSDQVLFFYGSGNNYVTLPEFTNALSDLQISFKWATESSSSGTLYLGYITDGDVDYNTFTQIEAYPASSTSYHALVSETVTLESLPATATRLAFRWNISSQFGCNVDDVEVALIPTCYRPTAANAQNVAQTTAEIAWTPDSRNAAGGSYSILDASDNELDATTTPAVTITGNTASISGLTEYTPYTFKVRTNCSNSVENVEDVPVSFTTLANCQASQNLTATNVTAAGATLTWTDPNSPAAGDYTIAQWDGVDETVLAAHHTTTSYALTGLTELTTYTYRVYVNCTATQSSDYTEVTFTTPCAAITTFPVTYGFETTEGFPANASTPTTNQLGNCWRNEATVQNGTYATRVWGTATSYHHEGSQSLILPDKGNNTNYAKTMLVFPPMNFTSANGYVVSFWIYRNGSASTPEGFKVYASTTDTINSTAIELGHYSRNYSQPYPDIKTTSGWYKYETDPIMLTGNVYLIFEGQSYYGSATYVDDIIIDEAPSCVRPSNLSAANLTQNTADLSWQDNNNAAPSSWTLYYKKASQTAYTEVAGLLTASYPLTGLDASTAYQYYVVAKCSSTDSSDPSAVFSFNTECGVITSLPWTENFDSYAGVTSGATNNLPYCWNYINTSTNSTYKGYPVVYNGTSYSLSVSNSLYFNSYSGSSPQDQYAILPEMQNVSGLRIKLNARAYSTSSSYNATFKVGVMTDPTDASTFVEVATETPTTTDYNLYTIPFDSYTGTGTYIAIMIEAATSNYRRVYIDDITVEEIPNCMEPSNVQEVANSATTTSVQLQWTAGGTETAWDIYCTTDPTDVPDNTTTPTVSNTADNPCTVTGLTHSTHYYAYVRARCSATDISPWSTAGEFNTECAAQTISATNFYTEDFDSYTGAISTSTSAPTGYPNHTLPNCWNFLNMSTLSSVYPQAFLSSSSSYAVTGNCLFFKSSSETPIYAILPTFEDDIADLQLTFTYRNEGTTSSNGILYAGYMTDPTDASTFTAVYTCERCTTKTTINDLSFLSAPAGSYIAFKYEGGTSNNYYLSIDDVVVKPYAYKMAIDANKWYAISTPVHNSLGQETFAGITNFLPTSDEFAYDLYRYEETTGTWENQKITSYFDRLERGHGYIYRRSTDAVITFNGTPNTGGVYHTPGFTASCPDADLTGFNLIGNPYPHKIYKGVSISDPALAEGWYELMPNGSWYARTNNDSIGTGQAALVKVSQTIHPTFVDDDSEPVSAKAAATTLAFTVKGNDVQDIAYAFLSEGNGLPKIAHFDEKAPMLSIPVDGRRYAIAMLGNDCESFNMVFRGIAGEYTLTLGGEFMRLDYIHLIDRATGMDIDLLQTPEYTFSATGNDADRFFVKLSPDVEDATTGNFVYWNGNAWIVEGTGTLQVFDLLGRKISSEEVDAQTTLLNTQFPSTGVYILRLGDKSQKIVVK